MKWKKVRLLITLTASKTIAELYHLVRQLE